MSLASASGVSGSLFSDSANGLVWSHIYENQNSGKQKSRHAIQSGKYRIFKYDTHYELWRWPDFIGTYENSQAAKEHAARLVFEQDG